MSYIKSTLLSDETLGYFARPHWVIFMTPVLAFIVALLLIIFGPGLVLSGMRWFGFYTYEFAAIICFLFGLIAFARSYIYYKTSEFGITDKRILMKTGWIQRNTLDMFLDKVEAVQVDQSVLGRILDYGTLIIVGTGGTADPFYTVPNPLGFRHKVQQQINSLEHKE